MEGMTYHHVGSNYKMTRISEPITILCFYLFKKYIYLFLAVLNLNCCALAFSSCSRWELLSRCGIQASYCGGFSCYRAQTLGAQTNSCDTWA